MAEMTFWERENLKCILRQIAHMTDLERPGTNIKGLMIFVLYVLQYLGATEVKSDLISTDGHTHTYAHKIINWLVPFYSYYIYIYASYPKQFTLQSKYTSVQMFVVSYMYTF